MPKLFPQRWQTPGKAKSKVLNSFICAEDTLYLEINSAKDVELSLPKSWPLEQTIKRKDKQIKLLQSSKWENKALLK